ncbi:MAG: oligoendopeptidase F, partial [Clostridia bacterium]|nr:oligoendopeptidase F [Clostridia bacterium]
MKREQVKEKHKWSIEDIFTSDEEWEKSFEKLSNSINFSKYAGRLSDADVLLKFLKAVDEFNARFERLFVYAHMRHDEDAGITKYAAYYSKTVALNSRYATELAFFDPEMAAQDESYLKALIADKRFSDYDYDLKRIIARKPHVLSHAEERLIGMSGELLDAFYETFTFI